MIQKGAASWLAPLGLLSLLSYRTQSHLTENSITYNELAPSMPIINQEKALQSWTCLAYRQFYGDIFSIKNPSSMMISRFVFEQTKMFCCRNVRKAACHFLAEGRELAGSRGEL